MATKSVSLSGVSLLALGLSFCPGQAASCSTNNGNLLSQTISHAQIGTSGQPDYEAAFSQTQLYTTYDEVNRLVSFSEGSGVRRGYGYDRYGNHWVDVDPAKSAGLPLSPLTPSGTAATGPNWYSGGNNRMTGVGYDAAGNQTQLNPFTLSYDAEGKQSGAVSGANGSAAYEYDGEGRRVRKWLCPNGGACSAATVGAQKTQYVYDAFGQLAAEYGGTASGAGVSYVSTDHLGSTRLRTNGQGGVEARYDYLPFGEQMGAGVNGRSAKHASGVYPAPSDGWSVLFTSKERDAETGLDYFLARYYSGSQGRFTSPDAPFMDQHTEGPQSWNLYAYVRSNPLKYRDPNGRWCVLGVGTTCNDDKIQPPPRPKPAVPPMSTATLLRLSRQPRVLSVRGANFIRDFEKFRSNVYQPTPKDKPTIGYGHVVKPGESFKDGLTEKQGDALFKQDAASFQRGVNRSVGVWIPQQAFDAFVSLAFNIGSSGFERSSIATKTNSLETVTESDFTQYNKQQGEVLGGLTNRRLDEFEIYSQGDYVRKQ